MSNADLRALLAEVEVYLRDLYVPAYMRKKRERLCARITTALAEKEGGWMEPEFGATVGPAIIPTHQSADAFWRYWHENGDTHKRGYYESTWGAINAALRTSGVMRHDYLKSLPAAPTEKG